MSEPVSMARMQKAVNKMLIRIELREEDEARERQERLERDEFRGELHKWSFMSDRR